MVKVNNKQTMMPCTDNDSVCYYGTIVSGFMGGFGGYAVIEGAAITDSQPPEAGTISMTANYKESPNDGQQFSVGDTVSGTFQ